MILISKYQKHVKNKHLKSFFSLLVLLTRYGKFPPEVRLQTVESSQQQKLPVYRTVELDVDWSCLPQRTSARVMMCISEAVAELFEGPLGESHLPAFLLRGRVLVGLEFGIIVWELVEEDGYGQTIEDDSERNADEGEETTQYGLRVDVSVSHSGDADLQGMRRAVSEGTKVSSSQFSRSVDWQQSREWLGQLKQLYSQCRDTWRRNTSAVFCQCRYPLTHVEPLCTESRIQAESDSKPLQASQCQQRDKSLSHQLLPKLCPYTDT